MVWKFSVHGHFDSSVWTCVKAEDNDIIYVCRKAAPYTLVTEGQTIETEMESKEEVN